MADYTTVSIPKDLAERVLSLIPISEPTRQAEISVAGVRGKK